VAHLRPFRGLRPPPSHARDIAAPPYDVLSAEEARAAAAGHPKSFLHVSRPEIDLPASVKEHSDEVYRQGVKNLHRFKEMGWLVQDPGLHFYLYRQTMGDHVQTGLVAAASVDEYDRGLIKKHELTRADKEEDRTKHMDALGGNDEPVFLTYRAKPDIDRLIEEGTQRPHAYDFLTDDGIQHTVWVVQGDLNARLETAFEHVPALYVADGHHRSAAASRVHAKRKGKPGEHERFLAVVFPDTQVKLLPYNRVVRDLGGKDAPQLLAALETDFEVTLAEQEAPSAPRHFGMYLEGGWYQLKARAGVGEDTLTGRLDVTLLHRRVLEPLLGVGDPRTDTRLGFVGGIRGPAELERLVDSKQAAVAFCLFPTRVEELVAIADAGQVMPPKSTWFEPKLRSGLVVHLF
jgi:uncharacterized protein (DUF1015 family)